MKVSKMYCLNDYDQNTDEHKIAEYYRIIPEEKSYSEDFNEDYVESDFEIPDFLPAVIKIELNPAKAYQATIDEVDEISELITDIKNSNHKFFKVLVKEECNGIFIKILRRKLPELQFDFSKTEDGYFLFKMYF